MNGYVCFYRGKRTEVYAETAYQAQKKALSLLGAKKSSDITVMLAEKNGQTVTHTFS